jgi:hypothetical protein
LADEAQRYLHVVEVFRAEGHEPRWQPERVEPPVDRPLRDRAHRSRITERST